MYLFQSFIGSHLEDETSNFENKLTVNKKICKEVLNLQRLIINKSLYDTARDIKTQHKLKINMKCVEGSSRN